MSAGTPEGRGRGLRALRSASPVSVVAGLVVLGFLGVTLGPALIGRGVLLDVGALTRFYPWRVGGVDTHAVFCRGDTVDAVVPQINEIIRGLRRGDIATWAPYTLGGLPLAALPNYGILNPTMWPYLVLPVWLAPAFVKLLQFSVAIAGTAAFLRRHGVRASAGVVAGVVFAACGFMIMWNNWLHTAVAAFVPALFWALDRAVVERRPRDIGLLGLVFASMVLGGFPAVILYSLTVAAVYVPFRAWQVRSGAGWGAAAGGLACAAAGGLLGIGLAAVQLLPFVSDLRAIGLEHRGSGPAVATPALLTAFAPDAYGTCAGGFYAVYNPIESIAFVGIGALVLALSAIVVRTVGGRERRAAAIPAVAALLAVLLACVVWMIWIGGTPLELLQRLPGYSTNPIGRASSVFGFLCAALAGFGLEAWLRRAQGDVAVPRSRSHLALATLVVAVAGALGLWVTVRGYQAVRADPSGVRGALHAFNHALIVPAILLLVALAGLGAVLLLRGRWRLVGPALVMLVVGFQSTSFAHELLPLSPRADYYPTTPAHRFLQEHIGHDRYGGASGWGYTPTSVYYGLRTPVGHGFVTDPWRDLLYGISRDIFATRTYSQFPGTLTDDQVADLPLLDQMSVRYWATAHLNTIVGTPDRARRATGHVRLTDDARASCDLTGGPLRGVQFHVLKGATVPERGAVAHVRLTSGDRVLESSRFLDSTVASGSWLRVGVPGEDLPKGSEATAELWFTGVHGRAVLRGDGGRLQCSAVRPTAGDGLRLVYSDESTLVYERTSTLPRIRWAGHSEVVPDAATRVERLKAGVDPDTVLLDSDRTPAADGSTARVDIVDDDPERISLDVAAHGGGYVVVADAIARKGWSATVDGRTTPIVPGNHAFAAVAVPDGDHRVTLSYRAPGFHTGKVVSLGAVALTGVLLVLPRRRRRARGQGSEPGPA